MKERRFIFTVTTGRSGTSYLAYLLGLLRNVQSHHEPAPSFVSVMRDAQTDSTLARDFLLEQKLPHYAKTASEPVCVETSHLFCKGFLNPWLENPELPVPDLIMLTRPPRKVAKSMLRLDTIPGRTEQGLRWYLAPHDPTNLTHLSDWESLTDYQLCYWYCLEISKRQEKYAGEVKGMSGRVVECTTSAIATWSGFNRVRKRLQLPFFRPLGLARYLKNAGKRINSKDRKKTDIPDYNDSELADLESEVVERTKSQS